MVVCKKHNVHRNSSDEPEGTTYRTKRKKRTAHYEKNDEKTKPYICKIYDFTKGDSNIPDQRNGITHMQVENVKVGSCCFGIHS